MSPKTTENKEDVAMNPACCISTPRSERGERSSGAEETGHHLSPLSAPQRARAGQPRPPRLPPLLCPAVSALAGLRLAAAGEQGRRAGPGPGWTSGGWSCAGAAPTTSAPACAPAPIWIRHIGVKSVVHAGRPCARLGAEWLCRGCAWAAWNAGRGWGRGVRGGGPGRRRCCGWSSCWRARARKRPPRSPAHCSRSRPPAAATAGRATRTTAPWTCRCLPFLAVHALQQHSLSIK